MKTSTPYTFGDTGGRIRVLVWRVRFGIRLSLKCEKFLSGRGKREFRI